MVVLQIAGRRFHPLVYWATIMGAVIGDYLDKPVAEGGLDLSRYTATIALFVLIVVLVLVLPQRAAQEAH